MVVVGAKPEILKGQPVHLATLAPPGRVALPDIAVAHQGHLARAAPLAHQAQAALALLAHPVPVHLVAPAPPGVGQPALQGHQDHPALQAREVFGIPHKFMAIIHQAMVTADPIMMISFWILPPAMCGNGMAVAGHKPETLKGHQAQAALALLAQRAAQGQLAQPVAPAPLARLAPRD